MDTLHGIPGMKTLQATSVRPIPLLIGIANRTLFGVQITVSGHSIPIERFLKFIQGLLLTQMSRILRIMAEIQYLDCRSDGTTRHFDTVSDRSQE